MTSIKLLHRAAMEKMDAALVARLHGVDEIAQKCFREAYDLESKAAQLLDSNYDAQPTRAILFRSAATLALECGMLAEAEENICKGLLGRPPAVIAEELREVWDKLHFKRHLELRGVLLGSEEMQMSIAGRSVGAGIAPLESFLGRIRNTEALLFRFAERKQGKNYREKGPREKSVNDNMQMFIEVPRAACFAVTLRVGGLQRSLPGLSLGEQVIEDFLDCLQLFKNDDHVELRQHLGNGAYYRNFLGLLQNIGPDGSNINMVGFTAMRRGETKQVALTSSGLQSSFLGRSVSFPPTDKMSINQTEIVTVIGTLKMADSRKRQDQIVLVIEEGIEVTVIVPDGMMGDIVKPLWERRVSISGFRKGKKIELMQIQEA